MENFLQSVKDELEAIKDYMEKRNQFHGYGQFVDLIAKIDEELRNSRDLEAKNTARSRDLGAKNTAMSRLLGDIKSGLEMGVTYTPKSLLLTEINAVLT